MLKIIYFYKKISCINNYMPDNHFTYSQLYAFVTGKASTAMARNLQRKFVAANVNLTIEQWSVLYSLWRTDGQSQQELSNNTFKNKPSITRLIDNLEKLGLVERHAVKTDRRINKIFLSNAGKALQQQTIVLVNETVDEALKGISAEDIAIAQKTLQKVYENLK
jgi:DNA-binding MarR family transcriptional regulator